MRLMCPIGRTPTDWNLPQQLQLWVLGLGLEPWVLGQVQPQLGWVQVLVLRE